MWIFFHRLLSIMHTLRLSYQNANKRQKILLRRDLIFASVFHRHLGPNLYIFTISPTFYRDFMTYHHHFTVKEHRPRWFRAKNLCTYCSWKSLEEHFSLNITDGEIPIKIFNVYVWTIIKNDFTFFPLSLACFPNLKKPFSLFKFRCLHFTILAIGKLT